MSVPARAYLSIGEVLGKLRSEFPDVTISKIRFLESEGLIDPQRTPSGYRKFTNSDLDRLRYVLLAQRDQYLPLKVIKENLDAIDRGLQPAANAGSSPTPILATVDGAISPSAFVEQGEMKLSRDELLSSSGITGTMCGSGAENLKASPLLKLVLALEHWPDPSLLLNHNASLKEHTLPLK